MKNHLGATIAIALGGLVSSAAGNAATVAVTSQSAFNSTVSGLVTGTFAFVPTNNPGGSFGGFFGSFSPLSGFNGLQGVTFSTPNLGGAVNVNSAFFYGSTDFSAPYAVNSVYTGGAPDILNILLPAVQDAFFLDFTTLFASTTATFTLSNGFTTSVSPTVAFPNSPEFLGFVSNVPFDMITLSVPSQQSWVVTDFGYGSYNGVVPVPEPSTWAMLLLGFAGLGYAGYRRAKADRATLAA